MKRQDAKEEREQKREAAMEALEAVVREAKDKASDLFDSADANQEYHVSITLTIGELRQLRRIRNWAMNNGKFYYGGQ